MSTTRSQSAVRRRAFTVLELVVGLAAGTMLMAGLASCLYFASESFEGSTTQVVRADAAQVHADMMADLSQAKTFSSRTATSVAFTVPDRDGDASDESLNYSWDSMSGVLSYSYNGGASTTLLENVKGLNLQYTSRATTGAAPAPIAYDANDWGNRWQSEADAAVLFLEFVESKLSSSNDKIAINTPAGTVDGDLLIAAVATDGDTSADLAAPAGWNLIVIDARAGRVTFGVWWKLASSEPSSHWFSWHDNEQAYGWIMRFSGHNAANPINDWAVTTTGSGQTYTPPSPAVTTTVENAMILRLGGFDDDDINVDAPGLPGHTAITMDESNSGSGTSSGGAGYVVQPAVGSSGTSTFTTTGEEQSVTVTIAIAPASGG